MIDEEHKKFEKSISNFGYNPCADIQENLRIYLFDITCSATTKRWSEMRNNNIRLPTDSLSWLSDVFLLGKYLRIHTLCEARPKATEQRGRRTLGKCLWWILIIHHRHGINKMFMNVTNLCEIISACFVAFWFSFLKQCAQKTRIIEHEQQQKFDWILNIFGKNNLTSIWES